MLSKRFTLYLLVALATLLSLFFLAGCVKNDGQSDFPTVYRGAKIMLMPDSPYMGMARQIIEDILQHKEFVSDNMIVYSAPWRVRCFNDSGSVVLQLNTKYSWTTEERWKRGYDVVEATGCYKEMSDDTYFGHTYDKLRGAHFTNLADPKEYIAVAPDSVTAEARKASNIWHQSIVHDPTASCLAYLNNGKAEVIAITVREGALKIYLLPYWVELASGSGLVLLGGLEGSALEPKIRAEYKEALKYDYPKGVRKNLCFAYPSDGGGAYLNMISVEDGRIDRRNMGGEIK